MASAVSGQNPLPSGNLYVTVVDEQGASLSGVTAKLSGPGAPQTTTSDVKGDSHFLNLSPGDYSVVLERAGFETVRRDVTVFLGKNAVLSITMPVGAAAETVTVSGDTAVLDSRKTETGATFGQKELQSIPTSRDPWAILRQVPGVLLVNTSLGGGDPSTQSIYIGKGSRPNQNTYNLDGVAITQTLGGGTPAYFDFDSLDNIEIATGGSDPSLSTPGVTLNLVTKRGTNLFLGSARALYTEHAGWDYGVEVGGPVWRDRLWLWGAAARNSFPGQTLVNNAGEPVQQRPTIEVWNAKLNAQLAPANSFVLSYLHSDKLVQGQGAGPDFSQPSTSDVTFPTAAYRVEDSQVLSAKLFASLYFSFVSSVFTRTPEGGIDKQADLDMDYVWRSSFAYYRGPRPQHQAGLTASSFFDTGDLRHELKFGFGYKHTLTESASSWPGDGLVGFEPSPSVALITRPSDAKYEVNYYDAYVGDIIQAGNLTLNVGARFDYQQGKNLPSAVPANTVFPDLLPAVHYAGDSGYPITWREFEPRVGATYALGHDRKTLLRGSYSRFANQLGFEVGSVNALGGAGLYYYWNDANGNHRVERSEVDLSNLVGYYGLDPNHPGSSFSVNEIAKNLKPPTTDEFIVGVERQIFSDLSASFAYTYRILRNVTFYSQIGTTRDNYQYIANAAGTATTPDGFVLNFNEPYYGLTTCPAPCAGVVLENRPDYKETYSGFELQVMKRLSHHWMLRAGFAYNDWQKQVGAGAIVNPNNGNGGSNASGPVVQQVNNQGPQQTTVYINSKWQFNVSGTVQLPLGIQAGANFFGRQGFPVIYVINAITHDTRENKPFIQIGQVGAYRLPDVFELDLKVEKAFRLGPSIMVSPTIDCFNVANSHTVLQRDGLVGTYDLKRSTAFRQQSNFNEPIELLSSRAFRGGVRLSF